MAPTRDNTGGRRHAVRTVRARLVAVSLLAAVAGGAAFFAGLPLAGGGEEAAVAGRGGKPNVVVVMTDDQELSSLRVMRNVKRLVARRGVTFKNAYATFPVCCPSRATFLTGQYAHNHKVRGNHPPAGGFERFNDSRTLPIALKRAGYRTSYVGRYLNGYAERKVPPGWSDWHVAVGKTAFRYFRYKLNENGRIKRYGNKKEDYQTDVYADRAASFIRRSASGPRPFFLTLAPLAPHGEPGRSKPPNPRPAPRHEGDFRDKRLPRSRSFNEADVSDKPFFVRKLDRLDRSAIRGLERRYQDRLESLLAVDDAVKRIVRLLKKTNELRRTLIIVTTDNGFMLGQHRLTAKGKLYEESAGIPLVMSGPRVPSGVARKQLVGNIDLAPTIFDLTGVRPLRTQDGRSLLPLARNKRKGKGRDLLFENQQSEAVRTSRYLYAEHARSEFELYDLKADPFQMKSRHEDPALAGLRSRLAARLEELNDCRGASCR